jgi:hypothetical protein
MKKGGETPTLSPWVSQLWFVMDSARSAQDVPNASKLAAWKGRGRHEKRARSGRFSNSACGLPSPSSRAVLYTCFCHWPTAASTRWFTG